LSSPGEENDNDDDDGIDNNDVAPIESDLLTSEIALDTKVASVIRQELSCSSSQSDDSSADDFDLHRDGFTYGDLADFDHHVAAISAGLPNGIDDTSVLSSESSVSTSSQVLLPGYVDDVLDMYTARNFYDDGMDSTLGGADHNLDDDVLDSNAQGLDSRGHFTFHVDFDDSDSSSTDSDMPDLITRYHDGSSDDDTDVSDDDEDDVSTSNDGVGAVDENGYHVLPLEWMRMSNGPDYIDAIDIVMRRLSILNTTNFASTVEAETIARITYAATQRGLMLRPMDIASTNDDDNESVSDDDNDLHIKFGISESVEDESESSKST
jgi:hypothetical protein